MDRAQTLRWIEGLSAYLDGRTALVCASAEFIMRRHQRPNAPKAS